MDRFPRVLVCLPSSIRSLIQRHNSMALVWATFHCVFHAKAHLWPGHLIRLSVCIGIVKLKRVIAIQNERSYQSPYCYDKLQIITQPFKSPRAFLNQYAMSVPMTIYVLRVGQPLSRPDACIPQPMQKQDFAWSSLLANLRSSKTRIIV